MNVKNSVDNKRFWETVKKFFLASQMVSKKIFLTEQDRMITEDRKIAEVFNDYFSYIASGLWLKVWDDLRNHSPKNKHPTVNAISKYQDHPRNQNIAKKISLSKLQH